MPGHTILNPVGNGYNYSGSGNSSTAPCNATGKIEITLSGNNVHPAGAINIRIPLQIFVGRDGQYVDKLALGVPMSPTIGEGNFNYRIDDDTVVISNVRSINDGATATIDFSYNIQHPSVFVSGSESDELKALLVVEDSGTVPVSAESKSLIAQVITRAETSRAYKTPVNGSIYWKDSWGKKPADADDYVYYIWKANAYVKTDVNHQPFAVSFEDTQVMVGGAEGEVVGYSFIAKDTFSSDYATASTKFGIMSFRAPPGDSFSLLKMSNSSGSSLGGINVLSNGNPFVPTAFSIRASGAAYGQTIGAGLPKNSADSYGLNPYIVEAVDDLVFMEGSEEPLLAGVDYEFSAVQVTRPYLYTYEENPDTVEYISTFVSDFNLFPEELVY